MKKAADSESASKPEEDNPFSTRSRLQRSPPTAQATASALPLDRDQPVRPREVEFDLRLLSFNLHLLLPQACLLLPVPEADNAATLALCPLAQFTGDNHLVPNVSS
jgi:hypothetical protein